MPKPKRTVSTTTAARHRVTKTQKRRRDASIVRLWRGGWTGKRIADHLGITPAIVGNVIRASGAARKRCGEIVTASLGDAPVAAWQQAMLPELEIATDDLGMTGVARRAVIFLGLLRRKPYEDMEAFKTWVHQVTGYALAEIGVTWDSLHPCTLRPKAIVPDRRHLGVQEPSPGFWDGDSIVD